MITKAGIGLRSKHHKEVLQNLPLVPWWEIHTENFFADGGGQISFLEKIRSHYPLSFHGVGLSLGSFDKPSKVHLKKIKDLVDRFGPFLISEHISWGSINNIYANDLLPIPYNEESLEIICRNIDITQNFLKKTILVENPSSYLRYKRSNITEESFINQICERTGCSIILDVNNIFVSGNNNGFCPNNYIDNIELSNVSEIHLAGHSILKTPNFTKLLDTHNDIVRDEVWDLYKYVMHKIKNPIATLIEWDQDIPELSILEKEAQKAQHILNQYETKRITI